MTEDERTLSRFEKAILTNLAHRKKPVLLGDLTMSLPTQYFTIDWEVTRVALEGLAHDDYVVANDHNAWSLTAKGRNVIVKVM